MGGGTRRRDAGAGGERRKRRKFAGAAATGDLRGMRGVLLTCDVHLERRAIREAFTMLEAFVAEDEERAGELAAADGEDKSGEKGGAKSAAESLASELAQLRGECKEVGGAKASRRFAVAQTGCSGQVLIRFSETADDPVLLTTRALTAAAASGNSGAPHIIRLFPVQTICAASSQAITTALAPLLEQLRGYKGTFAVEWRRRHNADIDKMTVISAVANAVCVVAPEAKVDLRAPAATVLVEIIKGDALVSVLPRWSELKEYNLRALAEANAPAASLAVDTT